MRYGVVLPGGTAPQQLALAIAAERAGWDGMFVWVAAYSVDAWTLLGAIAVNTSRVRLGTMPTPLPWGGRGKSPARRPRWINSPAVKPSWRLAGASSRPGGDTPQRARDAGAVPGAH